MVVVPTYERKLVSLGLGPQNVPKGTAEAFGSEVGAATQQLGKQIAATAESIGSSIGSAMGRGQAQGQAQGEKLNAEQENQNAITGKIALSNWQADVSSYANNALQTTDPSQASTIPDNVGAYGEQQWKDKYASQVSGRYTDIANLHRTEFGNSLKLELQGKSLDLAVKSTTSRLTTAADGHAARLAGNPDYLPIAAQDMRKIVDEVADTTLSPLQKVQLKSDIAVRLYNGMMAGFAQRAKANPTDQSVMDAAAKAHTELPALIPQLLGIPGAIGPPPQQPAQPGTAGVPLPRPRPGEQGPAISEAGGIVDPSQVPRVSGVQGAVGPQGVQGAAGASSPEDPRGVAGYIRQTAAKYGIDPNVAVRVAHSEGLSSFKSEIPGENSYGAFQLYKGGGLGNEFQKQTGLDPADPKNEKATIDFALKRAAEGGWGPWNGAKNSGIGQWQGIGRGQGGVSTVQLAGAPPLPDTGKGGGFEPAFFVARGGHPRSVNADFASRLQRIITAAEAATGTKVQITSMDRTNAEQAAIYERSGHGTKFMAAPPGFSYHERGAAADLAHGPALTWIRAHAAEFGLGHLSMADEGHIQIAGGRPGGIGAARGYASPGSVGEPPAQFTRVASGVEPTPRVGFGGNPQLADAATHWSNQLQKIGHERDTAVDGMRSNVSAALEDEDKRVKTGGERDTRITSDTLASLGYPPIEINEIENKRAAASSFFSVTKDWGNSSLAQRQADLEDSTWNQGPQWQAAHAQAESYSQHIEVEHNRAAASLGSNAMTEIARRSLDGSLTPAFVSEAVPYLSSRDALAAQKLASGVQVDTHPQVLADLAENVAMPPDQYRAVVSNYLAQDRLDPTLAGDWLTRNAVAHLQPKPPIIAAHDRLIGNFGLIADAAQSNAQANTLSAAAKDELNSWLGKNPDIDLHVAHDAADAVTARYMPRMFAAVRMAQPVTGYHAGLGYQPATLTPEQNLAARDVFDTHVMGGGMSKADIAGNEKTFMLWESFLAKQAVAEQFVKGAPKTLPQTEQQAAPQQQAASEPPSTFATWLAAATTPRMPA